jgi:hypothetical protein
MFLNKLSRYAEHDLQSLESHPASKNVFWRDVICAEVSIACARRTRELVPSFRP